MKKLDLRLFRLIKNSKGQFFAITLLIIAGLTVYTSLSMAAVNLSDTINFYYEETNFAHIFAQVVKIPETALDRVRNINGLQSVEGRIVNDVPLKVNDDEEKVSVRVVSVPDNSNINTLYLKEGKRIENESKDVLIVEQFAKARNIKVGDVITPQMGGRIFILNVKGIVASPEHIYLMENEQSLLPLPDKFGVIYISEELAQQSFGFKDSYNEIVVRIEDKENAESIKDKIEEELDLYGVKRIYTYEEQLSNRMVSEEINGLEKVSGTIPVVFLGVAAIIIAAMLSRMVRNDRTTIGVLKAMGYNNKNIILHYTKYSVIIGFIGSLLGILLGTIISGYLAEMYTMFFNIPMLKFKFYYGYTFSGIMLTIVFCIGAGIWGARRVMNIYPAESMRPQAPKSGGRVFLDRLGVLWKRFSFSWKMVLRNIFRSKKRIIFITLGIALTYAITLFPLVAMSGFGEIFEEHYGEFQKMDYNINFNKPMNPNVINDVKHIIEVDWIEPKIEYPFTLMNGTKEKVINIIGVPKDTQFYSFVNVDGEKIKVPKNGIILTEGLANYLEVQKGDKIKIKTFIPNKEDKYIEVKDIIEQSLGINGYMSLEEMRVELTGKEMITGVYLNSRDNVNEKLEKARNIQSIQSLEDMRNIFEQFLELTMSSIGVMVIFAGILGFAIVYNSTVMSISERSLEFSSLRVMGFSKKEIYKMVTKENGIMTAFGVILGIPIGRLMIRGFESVFTTDIYSFKVEPSFTNYLLTTIAVVIFVALAQLATKRKINRLDFIEALKTRIS